MTQSNTRRHGALVSLRYCWWFYSLGKL
jgi:hypothetical protein